MEVVRIRVGLRLVLTGPYDGQHHTDKKVQVCVYPSRAWELGGFSRFIMLFCG